MEKKRLTKTMWYGSDVDHTGNAILPEAAASDNHLSGLNEGEIYIHNHPDNPSIWTRTTDGKIVSISGVDISVLEKLFLSKTKDDRSKGKIASDKAIEVGNYVSGASGAIIYKDAENGQTVAEFDKLYVRMKAYFETLEIINVNTIGGKQIISPAGSVKCIGVEETDNAYRCYFLAEQDGEKVQNRFLVYDQIYSQMFDAVEGTSQNVSTHYFWRLCIAKSKEPVTFENKSCHYIDLSKTDCDKDSDVPMVGDVLNQRGNRTDLDRMNFIEMSSVDAFSPNITLFHGVNSYSLDGKAYVSYGVDKSTNKAFMNVYGDMYVGDRQNTSYMRYTQENGLEISGTLSIGTKLGDTPLKDLISASSPEGYQEFVEKVTQEIEGLQAQIDGAIESYFFQYDPTLGNYPASEWITEEQKKAHLNDTFTNVSEDSGHSWRWSLVGTTYNWVEIKDTATAKALQVAGQAKDTADGKRRVFVDTPYPPYDKGDLWSRGSEYPLMICVKEKDKNGVYEASDFDYADNNAKLKEEMQDLVGETKDELNNAIGQAKNEAVNNANAYTDEGKKALQASIDAMESSKANLDDVYTRAEADGKISESETNAINAAKAQADAAIALSEITIKAYADGIVDEEEAARIKQAKENLDAAKEYADEQAQKAIDEANDTYGYLAKALGTEVDGGLLLTSLIQMRDTDQNIMSGINGLTAKGDKSIATWWGGGMYDMFDYYDWDGAKWVAKKNIQIPSNVPSGVIRMDGTGYLAKGKFWWDESGKIYADPTALFLSFDVEAEAGTLSATIVDIRDKQTEFADMWEFKTDANGRKYLLSKYPLVTQEGITMYSGVGTTIPSIYDGLPIDGTTIYWENGILKAQGGGTGGGGSIDFPLSWSGFSSGSFDGSAAKTIYIPSKLSELTNDSGYALSSALSGYLPLTGGTMTGNISWNNDSHGIYFYNGCGIEKWQGYSPSLVAESGTDFFISNKTDRKINYLILHSGNYSSYALPLSGGTISGNLYIGDSNNTDWMPIRFRRNGVVTFIGQGPESFDVGFDNGYLTVGPDRLLYIKSSYQQYDIIHSGNISSQSVSYASSAGRLYTGQRNNVTHYPTDIGIEYFGDVNNTQEGLFDTTNNANGILHVRTHSQNFFHQLGFSSDGNIYSRYFHYKLPDTTTPWKRLAFTDSNVASATTASNVTINYLYNQDNDFPLLMTSRDVIGTAISSYVATDFSGKLTYNPKTDTLKCGTFTGNAASATKLQTARTIWGQSFDGTGNVSGALSNVSEILFKSSGKIDEWGNIHFTSTTGTWAIVSPTFGDIIGVNNNTGNVGIGTATPAYKLDVSGATHSTDSVFADYSIFTNSGKSGCYLHGKGISWHDSTNSWVMDLVTYGASNDLITLHRPASLNGGLSTTYASATRFLTNKDTDTGIWTGSVFTGGLSNKDIAYNANIHWFLGSVGVGTNNPSYTLQVAGDLGVNNTINLYRGDQINGVNGIAFNFNLGKYVNVSIYDGNEGRIAHFVTGGITFNKSLSIYSSLYVDSTSTFQGKTTHNGGASILGVTLIGQESNNIYNVFNDNGAIKTNSTQSGSSIRNALNFQWYDTSWQIGNIRGSASDSAGFGITSSNNNLRFRVTTSQVYCYGGLEVTGATTLNSGLNINGAIIQQHGENRFAYGSYRDPASGISSAIKVSGGISQFEGDVLLCTSGSYNVGIGTLSPSAKLHVAGNILTSGSITMNSMRSMKNIINENGLSLEELSTIKPTRFTWKDGRDDRIHVGGIADDVMKVLPEVVFKGSDGVLSMDYASAAFVMAASLIQPMTEHERRIANLERENALLKEEIRNLKSA